MNIFFRERRNGSLFVIGIGLYLLGLLFVIISLISYNPTDSSLVYISSDGVKTNNACGLLGAHLAALLIYFFGGAVFLLLIPLLYGLYIYAQEKSLSKEWERLGAALYIVFIGAAFCVINGSDGGIIGLLFAQKLAYYFDTIGRAVFLGTSISLCMVLLLRWSFIWMIQWVMAAVFYCYALMQRYHVMNKIGRVVIGCVHTIVIRLPLFFITFVQSLLNGDAFNDTGLVVPDEVSDEYNNESIKLNFFIMSLQKHQKKAFLKDDIEFLCITHRTASSFDAYTGSVRDQEEETQEPLPGIIKDPIVKVSAHKVPRYTLPHKNIFIAEKELYEDQDLEKELQERAHVLHDKLKRFGVAGEVVAIKRGPVVTLFEYQPDVDTKLSKIIVLEDDLAMALQAMSIRIIAPIPGRSVVGFEVANNKRNDVLFSQIVTSPAYTNFTGSLPLVLGKGTIGDVVVVDLARMPHLLIAGSTGSGKSVALNAILISLLCKLSPDELKLILIDPKRLEFASFTDIAHLLFPIVTSPVHAAPVLRWVVQEMEDRYEKMAQCGARNITDYNARMNGNNSDDEQPLPFIVVIIDELADLMITAGRDIEDLITRITQMARAAGIHMIVATQRPSVDVITGLIKANFPSRISFRVASRIDSRTILDVTGADRLLGRGDMLFLDASISQLKRVHGAYVSDEEIERVADHIRLQRKVEYLDQYQTITTQGTELHPADDVLYQDVRQFLDEIDEISISLLQRKFRIGYNRSARIIDMLESQGLIMPQDGSKTRKVIR